MPKERTHWLLARKSRDLLPGGPLKELLEREEAAYLIGAVAPDSLFMPVKAKHLERDFFHGKENGNTYSFWNKAEKRGWLKEDWRKAYCFGLTSHIQSDAHYHPLVYYFCSWPEYPHKTTAGRSMLRHFRLETLLDLYYGETEDPSLELLFLDDMTDQIPIDALSEMASVLLTSEMGASAELMNKLILSHGAFQRRFSQPLFIYLTTLLKLLGIRLGGKRDLIYRKPPGEFVKKPLEYRDPVTGETFKTDWSRMLQETTIKTSEVFLELDRQLQGGTLATLSAGPHLETGKPSDSGVKPVQRYCHPQKPESLFL